MEEEYVQGQFKKLQAQRMIMQKKTFTNWLNNIFYKQSVGSFLVMFFVDDPFKHFFVGVNKFFSLISPINLICDSFIIFKIVTARTTLCRKVLETELHNGVSEPAFFSIAFAFRSR